MRVFAGPPLDYCLDLSFAYRKLPAGREPQKGYTGPRPAGLAGYPAPTGRRPARCRRGSRHKLCITQQHANAQPKRLRLRTSVPSQHAQRAMPPSPHSSHLAASAERLLRAHRAGFSKLSQRQLEQLIAMDPSRDVPDMDPSVCGLCHSWVGRCKCHSSIASDTPQSTYVEEGGLLGSLPNELLLLIACGWWKGWMSNQFS